MLKRESMKSETGAAREIPRDRYHGSRKDKLHTGNRQREGKSGYYSKNLFEDSASKAEIVTTFQALLELLKHQVLIVSQEEIFSSITIMKNPNRKRGGRNWRN